jgi:hypothetical protein
VCHVITNLQLGEFSYLQHKCFGRCFTHYQHSVQFELKMAKILPEIALKGKKITLVEVSDMTNMTECSHVVNIREQFLPGPGFEPEPS